VARTDSSEPVGRAFFARPVLEVAPALIGCTLLVDGAGGRIVEVEAYGPNDEASHAWPGPTLRNRAMFGPPGHAYIYRSYGIHWMLNLVCEEPGVGTAVLIRAIVPEVGADRIAARRPGVPLRDWCRGPGRLTVALAIGPQHDGLALDAPPFRLEHRTDVPEIAVTLRIGITKAADRPWRFVEAGSRFASGPALSAAPRPR
jgi:DNA-3-methyladenine glycosylase